MEQKLDNIVRTKKTQVMWVYAYLVNRFIYLPRVRADLMATRTPNTKTTRMQKHIGMPTRLGTLKPGRLKRGDQIRQ